MKRSPCSRPVRSIRVEMLCAPLWHDSPRPRQMCLFVKILISEIVTFLMPRAASSEIQNCLLATGSSHCSSDSAFHGHLHIFSLDILHCGAPLENDLLFPALGLQCCAEGMEGLPAQPLPSALSVWDGFSSTLLQTPTMLLVANLSSCFTLR